MTTEVVITDAAERDLGRLDRQNCERVIDAIRRYAASEQGNVRRLRASDELRLRVGDWRVRFTSQVVNRPEATPAIGVAQVKLITILRVLRRDKAYRD